MSTKPLPPSTATVAKTLRVALDGFKAAAARELALAEGRTSVGDEFAAQCEEHGRMSAFAEILRVATGHDPRAQIGTVSIAVETLEELSR